jgi:hypothetical protein
MATESLNDDGSFADDFEMREAIGETGVDEFAQTLGEAIGQQLQAQQAPPPQDVQQAQLQALAAEIAARRPELATEDGVMDAAALAQHVAGEIGRPEIMHDLGFLELMHVAAKGLSSGKGRYEVPITEQIVTGSSDGRRRGSTALPFS